jgi:thiosulfate/3-mercaptopyruvate sulfurtransferase
MTTDTEFANPHFLADPAWLQAHLNDPNLVIVDLDAEAGYLRGHIPGSVFLDNNYERNPATGWVDTFPPDRFAVTCQALGIGDDTLVVAYDNNMSLHAARFWWTLAYYGHRNVRVLDGGWRSWVSEGGAVAFDRSIPRSDVVFTAQADPSLIVGYDEVRAGCSVGGANTADTVIWDTRTSAEYDGTVSRNKRPGHVAGAVHLDWQDLMARASHRFKPPGELRRLLGNAGITPDKAVFAY